MLVSGALAASGVVLAQVRAPRLPGNIFPLSEVRAGMRGYGLTVFRGTRPERFNLEVIDVLHNFRPHMDLILIRPDHPILDHAGIVGGMSGSPIFLDGRMAGAYAYGWEFGRDPVAGVTPIEAMLDVVGRPRRQPPGVFPGTQFQIPLATADAGLRAEGLSIPLGPAGQWQTLSQRVRGDRDPVPTPYGSLVPVSTPWMVSGLASGALRHLSEALEPLGVELLQATGAGQAVPPADAPTRYEDGGAVAVQLVSGDVSAQAIGTVTRVDGTRVAAFGHPMLSQGETAVPAAIARVLWILASSRRSVKLGEPVRPLGAMVQDRGPAIVLDTQAPAPTTPVHVRVEGAEGAPHTDWNMRVAGHRAVVARLVNSVIESALEETAVDLADAAWTVRSVVSLRGWAPLEFTDTGAGAEGVRGIQNLAAPDLIARVSDNAFGVLLVERVDVTVQLRWARDLAYVRAVGLSRAEVDPGESVELRVVLGRYGAPPEVLRVSVPLPRDLAGREVELEVTPGNEAPVDVAEPETLEDLARNATLRYPSDVLVVSYRGQGQGLALRGRVVQNLPSSAADLLRASNGTDGAEPVANLRRIVVPVGRVVVGRDRVRVRVREVRL
jgi:hypothetical protein